MTLFQSPSLVYLIFNVGMYSIVIDVAILVNRAALLDIIILKLRFKNANVLQLIVEADPIEISVIINNISHISYYQFLVILKYLKDHAFQLYYSKLQFHHALFF